MLALSAAANGERCQRPYGHARRPDSTESHPEDHDPKHDTETDQGDEAIETNQAMERLEETGALEARMRPAQTLPDGFFLIDVADILTIVFVVILVVLFWRTYQIQELMATIQQTQAELMEQQTAFLKANHRPIIDLEAVGAEQNTLHVTLQNRGNGPARNLQLQCVVYKQNGETTNGPTELRDNEQHSDSVADPAWAHLWKTSAPQLEANRGTQNPGPHDGIEPNSLPTQFEADISFAGTLETRPHESTFSEVMEQIRREWSVEHIALDFHIAFTDVTIETHTQPIGSFGNIPTTTVYTLEEAIDDAQIRAPIGDAVSSEHVSSVTPAEMQPNTAE